MTNNPQPPVVAEPPERVWFYRLYDGTWMPTWSRTAPTDTEYIRASTPDSIAEKARRAAEEIGCRWGWTHPNMVEAFTAIIATEFAAGGESTGESKS